MVTRPYYLTEQGRVFLQAKLELLKDERLELIERLTDAKSGGDWMDSAEHTLVENELAFAEAQIRELELILETAVAIPPDPDPTHINVGDTVVLESSDGTHETYTIVGGPEANPSAGLISDRSPLGQALLNHEVGDDVVVKAPAGELHFRVLALDGKNLQTSRV